MLLSWCWIHCRRLRRGQLLLLNLLTHPLTIQFLLRALGGYRGSLAWPTAHELHILLHLLLVPVIGVLRLTYWGLTHHYYTFSRSTAHFSWSPAASAQLRVETAAILLAINDSNLVRLLLLILLRNWHLLRYIVLVLTVWRLGQVVGLYVCNGPWCPLRRVLLCARMSRVGPVYHAISGSQVHMARAFLTLDVLIDILDVGYHGVLTWRELVVWATLLVRLSYHLSGDGTLLLHRGLGRARTTTERTETHRC